MTFGLFRITSLTSVCLLIFGCATQGMSTQSESSTTQYFTDIGVEPPTLWCRAPDYVNDSGTAVLYLWRKSGLNQNTIMIPEKNFIEAQYHLDGLNDRWDWEKFSLVVGSDGTGRFYDFRLADEDGIVAKASSVYRCCKYTGRNPVCPQLK